MKQKVYSIWQPMNDNDNFSGNAYFAHFFLVSQNPKTLKHAMSAYSQADKDPVSRSTPELHYNKVCKYIQIF